MEVNNIKRRIKGFYLICLLPIFIIIGRLVYLQTFKHDELTTQAQKRVYTKTKEDTFRGRILDRNGVVLAESLRTYAIALSKRNVKDKEKTIEVLSKVLSIKPQILRKLWADKNNFFYVKKKVTPIEYEKLENEINKNHLLGIEIEPQYTRIYPYGVAQDIIGATNSKNVGLSGIEMMYNEELTDKQESILVKKARSGGIIYKEGQFRKEETADIYLTIDALGQYFTEDILRTYAEKFKVHSAMAIVQNPYTGEILAAASYPSLDGRSLPFQFTYEPGSTFKTIAVATALNEGLIEPDESFSMEHNAYKITGKIIKDHQDKPSLTVTEILERSSNIGAAKIAERIGAKTFFSYLQKFGFGAKTEIGFLGESAGILRDHTLWKPIDTAKAGYGYTVSVSGIQLVTAYSAIANGGSLMTPHLISKIKYSDDTEEIKAVPKLVREFLKPETIYNLKKMLKSVVENGTGGGAKIPSFETAGKTGTSEKLKSNGKYESSAHIASFCGFVPVDKPRLTILVVLDEPERALFGSVSARIFAEIASKFLTLYPEVNNSKQVKEINNAN